MNTLMIGMLLLAGPQVPPPNAVIGGLTEEQIRSFDPIGTCVGNGRSIDMHRVMFLENQSLELDSPDGPARVSIQGEDFVVDELGPKSGRRHYYDNIDSKIDANTDLDIELKFAYFEHKLTLFWKETFRNRIYRQGMFNVAGHVLTPMCEGQGGSHIER